MPRPLPDRARTDSVGEFRRAARARFAEGGVLADAGHKLGAIHLWGYAAEMTLKAAYFRAVGFDDVQPITRRDLKGVDVAARALGVVWAGDLHNLEQLTQLLAARQVTNSAAAYADPAFGARVVDAGRRVYAVWRVTLRYHVNKASDREVETVRSQTGWLLGKSRVL